LIATCASASGETVALVSKHEFWVYRLSTTSFLQDSLRPKFIGKFENDGDFKCGLGAYQLKSQGHIMSDNRKREFEVAATTDSLLVIGTAESGCLLFFSITDRHNSSSEGEGKCTLKEEHTDRTIRKLFFNGDGSELAVMFYLPTSRQEICRVYSVGLLPLNTSSSLSVPKLDCRPDCDFDLKMTYQTYQIPQITYRYTPRDATFSSDGSKIVICTNHDTDGSTLVYILVKIDHNRWQWVRDRVLMQRLDTSDMACLGYTGVSL
jgi:hypothetical protein